MDEFSGAHTQGQPSSTASAAPDTAAPAPDVAFQRLTRLTVQLLGADWAGLVLTEGAAQGPVLAAQTGALPTDLDLSALPVEPEAMSVNLEAPAPGTGFRLASPVHAPDGPGGWLLVGVRSPRSWTEDDARALADLAALVGGELERRAAALALTSERAAFAAQQDALHSARHHLMLALESAPLVLWATDMGGRFTLSEGRGLERLNSSPGALVGQTVTEVLGHVPGIQENVQRTLSGESFTTHIRLGGRTFEARYSPLHHPDGRQSGALGVGYDVTELLESQRAARQAQSQAEVLLELSRVLDVDGDLQHAASAALSVLTRALGSGYMGLWRHRAGGFQVVTMQGEVPDTLREYQQRGISDSDRYAQALLSGQSLFLNPHDLPDRVRGLGLHGAALLPVTLDSAIGVLILGAYRTEPRPWSDFERDLLSAAARTLQVSVQRRHSLRDLQQAAHTEPLTGLGNRRAFQTDLEAALAQMHVAEMSAVQVPAMQVPVTLVAVDLDGLKQVNDQGGHHRGDALLQAYGLALQTTFQSGRVYRLGGDEFVVLLTGTDLEGAELLRRMADVETLVRGAGFDVGASAGAASAPREVQSAAELIRLSDARMYEAKATRRSARHLGARHRAPGNGGRDA